MSRAATFELKKRPTGLLNVMERAVEAVAPLLEPRQRDLELLPPLHTIELEVDLDRMGQAVGHLLRNALQNSAPGTKVTLAASGDGQTATLAVEDQGAGIDPRRLPLIFVAETSPLPFDLPGDGQGFGLALTKSIIERHGGTLVAESAGLGWGSRFTVKIPVVGAISDGSPGGGAARRGLLNRRVLLVDDNVDAAEMLGEILAQNGHVAEIAHTADEAMRALATFQPHLALLDIGLPDIDGFELATRLRSEAPSIRLISLSGYGDERTRERSKDAGFEAHFTKPIVVAALLQLMQP